MAPALMFRCSLVAVMFMLPLLASTISVPSRGEVSITLPGFVLEESIFTPEPSSEPMVESSAEPQENPLIMRLARKYIPIFRFDKDSDENCYPDDKRQHMRLSGTCKKFSPTAYVFMNALTCGEYMIYQYNLWFGSRKSCTMSVEGRRNDSQYVQVWTNWTDGKVEKVRYGQNEGYYFRKVGSGVEMRGNRTVVYIGKNNHGMYHRRCSMDVLKSGTKRCLGGCTYWEDFRRPNGSHDLDRGTLVPNDLDVQIDCNPAECRPGHTFWREISSSSCYGVFN